MEKKLGVVDSCLKCLFEKKIVCLSVCVTFFESAGARDLGLMTLFLSKTNGLIPCSEGLDLIPGGWTLQQDLILSQL